ncbi:IS110 family transposase [Ectothiorhodospira variabilis]|uniref:IS110 family transposase n=1 Tax=Ectothiorhodospira variabilis TaxID=505694 RepID=UPI001EFBE535|nr:IS110 family transposase [Ectothiorhodospira variabilis]MCG5499173.1 IS110 family transposase [Ectothiorhodospira variabilis]
MSISTIGIDIGKSKFHVCALDERGHVKFRRAYSRSGLIQFLANTPPARVATEACAGAHFVGRKAQSFDHEARLLPGQYVKAYVKSQKNDFADAEAIAEASTRPTMRSVPVKPADRQALQLLHRQRSAWIGERTALANRIRAMLLEFGITIPKSLSQLRRQLPCVLEDAENELPDRLRELIVELWDDITRLDKRLKRLDSELETHAHADPQTQLLLSIPGIGPVIATALISGIGDASTFRKGRDLAAWMGLVPRQYSTGGQTRLLGIGKRGNAHLRMLLIHGARAVLRVASKRSEDDGLRRWVERVTARKHPNVAAVALANKMARIVHAVLRHNTPFKAQLMGA